MLFSDRLINWSSAISSCQTAGSRIDFALGLRDAEGTIPRTIDVASQDVSSAGNIFCGAFRTRPPSAHLSSRKSPHALPSAISPSVGRSQRFWATNSTIRFRSQRPKGQTEQNDRYFTFFPAIKECALSAARDPRRRRLLSCRSRAAWSGFTFLDKVLFPLSSWMERRLTLRTKLYALHNH